MSTSVDGFCLNFNRPIPGSSWFLCRKIPTMAGSVGPAVAEIRDMVVSTVCGAVPKSPCLRPAHAACFSGVRKHLYLDLSRTTVLTGRPMLLGRAGPSERWKGSHIAEISVRSPTPPPAALITPDFARLAFPATRRFCLHPPSTAGIRAIAGLHPPCYLPHHVHISVLPSAMVDRCTELCVSPSHV